MAIQVALLDAGLSNDGLGLVLDTTNDAHPGVTIRVARTIDLDVSPLPTPAQIKAKLDAEISLLWTAMAVENWIIP